MATSEVVFVLHCIVTPSPLFLVCVWCVAAMVLFFNSESGVLCQGLWTVPRFGEAYAWHHFQPSLCLHLPACGRNFFRLWGEKKSLSRSHSRVDRAWVSQPTCFILNIISCAVWIFRTSLCLTMYTVFLFISQGNFRGIWTLENKCWTLTKVICLTASSFELHTHTHTSRCHVFVSLKHTGVL